MSNSADIIARRLHAVGCRQAFGIPGGEVLTLVHALHAQGIEFVLAKHENAAGFMAEGAYQARGAPAVLVATLGPGVANAVNVVANAWQDRVPMIFLTGCVDPAVAHGYTHQVFDHGALLAPVAKATFTLTPDSADLVMDKALAIAVDGRPGPVHVDVPMGVAEAPHREPQRAQAPALAGCPRAADLGRAREWLQRAERPLLMVGLDVLTQGGETAIGEFVEQCRVPVITTYKAKGVLDETDPLSLGAAGLSPKADGALLPLVQRADVVVLAGYDPIEMRAPWREPFADGQRIIEFSAVAATHGMHRASVQFIGDVAAGLRALAEGCTPVAVWADGDPSQVRDALRRAFAPGDAWGPGQVIAIAREELPAAAVATVDSGAHRILLSQMWACSAPRTLLQSTGLCTMGCALPLAIGYKRSAPDTPVVAFTGDAGLEMVLGELATLRDAALPVIVVVFCDASLALIELKQRRLQHPSVGVDFDGTDFVGVARAFGMQAAWVDDAAGLRDGLRHALGESRSTLLACRIPRRSYDQAF